MLIPGGETWVASPQLTEPVTFLITVLLTILLGYNGTALQAQVIGGQRGRDNAVGAPEGLGYRWGLIEYDPQQHLVVLDRVIHDIRAVR